MTNINYLLLVLVLFVSCNKSNKSNNLDTGSVNIETKIDTTIYPYDLRNLGIEPSVEELSDKLKQYGKSNHPNWPRWYLIENDFDNDGKKDRVYLLKGLQSNNDGDKYYLLYFKKKRVGYESFVQIESYSKPGVIELENKKIKVNFDDNIERYAFENNVWKKIINSQSNTEKINNNSSGTSLNFKDIQLNLIDASLKKAKIYLGEPDKYEYGFGHVTKGFAIYYNKVSNPNGNPLHLVLFLRMNGNQWGNDSGIEEIYAVDENEKACFGIHCLKINNEEIYTNALDLIVDRGYKRL
jgi:hypothetical protein